MSRLRSHFPSFFRFAAWLALLAMLAPVVTGLMHHPARMQNVMRSCGMPISASENTQTSKDAPHHKQDQLPSCPICQSLHMLAGGFMPPDSLIFIVPVLAATIYLLRAPILRLGARIESQARPRAPPAFA